MEPLNLSRLQTWIAQGRIDPRKPITIRELASSGCIKMSPDKDGVKLLAKQDPLDPLRYPIQIIVSRASAQAIEQIEKAGGQVVTRYYTPSSIKRILARTSHPYYSTRSLPLAPLTHSAKLERVDPTGLMVWARSENAGTSKMTFDEKSAEVAQYRYRLPDPAGRRDLEYYRDEAHRGYLSYTSTLR